MTKLTELEGETEQSTFLLGNFSPSCLRKLWIRKPPKLSEGTEDLNCTVNHLCYKKYRYFSDTHEDCGTIDNIKIINMKGYINI